MIRGKKHNTNRIVPLAIMVLSLIMAFTFWWSNGVLAILLMVVALASCVFSACQFTFEPSDGQVIAVRASDIQQRRVRPRRDPFREETIAIEEIIDLESADPEEKITDIQQDLPVEIIDGIGQSYGSRLREMNIDIVKKMVTVHPEVIKQICEVNRETAEHWIADAKCLIKGARIYSILELAMSEPAEVLIKIEKAIDKGKLDLPNSYEINEWKIRQWIDTANDIMSSISSDDFRKWKGKS
ncbi:MAG: hypothetical protein GF411_20635 [Candidatus Lokiarchaeota archaeon]|nr:hypothetical protein [Candidatus Lokiarchaeota archaeon]